MKKFPVDPELAISCEQRSHHKRKDRPADGDKVGGDDALALAVAQTLRDYATDATEPLTCLESAAEYSDSAIETRAELLLSRDVQISAKKICLEEYVRRTKEMHEFYHKQKFYIRASLGTLMIEQEERRRRRADAAGSSKR